MRKAARFVCGGLALTAALSTLLPFVGQWDIYMTLQQVSSVLYSLPFIMISILVPGAILCFCFDHGAGQTWAFLVTLIGACLLFMLYCIAGAWLIDHLSGAALLPILLLSALIAFCIIGLTTNDKKSAAYILGVSGDYVGKQMGVDSHEVLLGRDPAICQLVFDRFATDVSRRHCGLTYNAQTGLFVLTDYSKTGVYLSDGSRLERYSQVALPPGTTISLGSQKRQVFRLETREEN